MKLIFTTPEKAEENMMILRRERINGAGVCLVCEENRKYVVQNYHAYGAYFISSSGAFAFGGCYRWYQKESAYLQKTADILQKMEIPYSFVKEDISACGGILPVMKNTDKLAGERYNQVIAYQDEQLAEIRGRLAEYADVHPYGKGLAYMTFHDIRKEDAMQVVIEKTGVKPKDITVL